MRHARTSDQIDRVRECANGTCGWLFVDTSRNRSRRWRRRRLRDRRRRCCSRGVLRLRQQHRRGDRDPDDRERDENRDQRREHVEAERLRAEPPEIAAGAERRHARDDRRGDERHDHYSDNDCRDER